MALGNDGIRPSSYELWVRTGCGFLFGALVEGLSLMRWFPPDSAAEAALALLAGGVLCALLARHYGDRFWSSLKWWLLGRW